MVEVMEHFKMVSNPFSIECIEEGTNLELMVYSGRGERRYGVGRQLINRGCDDALVSYDNGDGRGILLITRDAEHAREYLWPLGGFTDKGIKKRSSLASRVQKESGLEIDISTMVKLGDARMIWNTTPYNQINVPSKVRDIIANQEISGMTMQEVFNLLNEKGIYEEVSGMTMQSFADLVQERNLPTGIDDFGNLFYVQGSGNLKLDFLHKNPVIVSPKMYTPEFRETLHPYVQLGMDRAIPLIK